MPRLELCSVKYGNVQEKSGLSLGLANAHLNILNSIVFFL